MWSFLSKRSSLLIRKVTTHNTSLCSNLNPVSGGKLLFYRSFSSHSQDQLYIPFATDSQREYASIMFCVSKHTNLKEVNVNIRVISAIFLFNNVESISSILEFFF